MKVKLNTLECKRCGHKWTPRKPEVIMCPKCKSINWDKPRKETKMRYEHVFKPITGSDAKKIIQDSIEKLNFYEQNKEDYKALEKAGLGHYVRFQESELPGQDGYRIFHLNTDKLEVLRERAQSTPEDIIRDYLLKDQEYQGFDYNKETKKYENPKLDAKIKELMMM